MALHCSHDSLIGIDITVRDIVKVISGSDCSVRVNELKYKNLATALYVPIESLTQVPRTSPSFLSHIIKNWVWTNNEKATVSALLDALYNSQLHDEHDRLCNQISKKEVPFPNLLWPIIPLGKNRSWYIVAFLALNIVYVLLSVAITVIALRATGSGNHFQGEIRAPVKVVNISREPATFTFEKVSANTAFLYSKTELDSEMVLSIPNLNAVTKLTWNGCVTVRRLHQILVKTLNIKSVVLEGHYCELDTKQSKVRHFQDPSPISLPSRLGSVLRLNGLQAIQELLLFLSNKLVMGNLEMLHVSKSKVSSDDRDIVTKLIVGNENLKIVIFEELDWNFWFFGLNFEEMGALKELVIDYNDPSKTTKFSLDINFCTQFPHLELLNITSYLHFNEVYKVISCNSIKSLAMNLFVPTDTPAVNMLFLENAVNLEALHVNFIFESNFIGDCEVSGVKAAQSQYDFLLKVQSNCANIVF